MSKATLATVKSFIRKNNGNLFISTHSHFDGMVDCVMPCEDQKYTSVKIEDKSEYMMKRTMGLNGAWFVGDSRDSIAPFDDGSFKGFEIFNSCGCFSIAIKL